MASLSETLDAFVQFVQAELFRRPFLNNDPKQETVLVRRGGGPRQLNGVELEDGQVLGQEDGVLKGITLSEIIVPTAPADTMIFTQPEPTLQWTILHDFESTFFEVHIVGPSGERIFPDDIQITATKTITVYFTKVQSGTALIRWYT